MTPTLELNQSATAQFSAGVLAHNLIYSAIATARDARERFLARHGPSAELRRHPATPKEIRKALLAAEMAQWEGF